MLCNLQIIGSYPLESSLPVYSHNFSSSVSTLASSPRKLSLKCPTISLTNLFSVVSKRCCLALISVSGKRKITGSQVRGVGGLREQAHCHGELSYHNCLTLRQNEENSALFFRCERKERDNQHFQFFTKNFIFRAAPRIIYMIHKVFMWFILTYVLFLWSNITYFRHVF